MADSLFSGLFASYEAEPVAEEPVTPDDQIVIDPELYQKNDRPASIYLGEATPQETVFTKMDASEQAEFTTKVQSTGDLDLAFRATRSASKAFELMAGISPEKAQELDNRLMSGIPYDYASSDDAPLWDDALAEKEVLANLFAVNDDGTLKNPYFANYVRNPVKLKSMMNDVDTGIKIEEMFIKDDGGFVSDVSYRIKNSAKDIIASYLSSGSGISETATQIGNELTADLMSLGEAGTADFVGSKDYSSEIGDALKSFAESDALYTNQDIGEGTWVRRALGTSPQIGAYILNPNLGLGTIASLTFSNLYNYGRNAGYSPLESTAVSSAVTTAIVASEAVELGALKNLVKAPGLKSLIAKNGFKTGLSKFAKTAVPAIIEPLVQEPAQSVIEEGGKIVFDMGNRKVPLSEIISRGKESAVSGLGEGRDMLFYSVIGIFVKGMSFATQASASKADVKLYKEIKANTDKSNNVAGVSELVAKVSEDNGVDGYYVSAENITRQFQTEDQNQSEKNKADLEALKDKLGKKEEEWAESMATGNKMKFDADAWFNATHKTDFGYSVASDLAFREGAFSENEMTEMATVQKTIAETALKEAVRKAKNMSFAGDEGILVNELYHKIRGTEPIGGAKKQINKLKKKLGLKVESRKKSNVNTKDAKAQAQVITALSKQLGEKRGMSAREFIDSKNITLRETNEKLFKDGKPVKGMVDMSTAENIITQTKSKDPTTIIHEFNHILFEDMRSLVEEGIADEQTVNDYKVLEEFADGDLFENMEKVLLAFDTFITEGKAPSLKLTNAFSRMRRWITNLWRKIAGNGITPSDEVRAVFNRMLASEAEITEVEDYYNMKAIAENYLADSEYTYNKAKVDIGKAHDASVNRLLGNYMKIYKEVNGESWIKNATATATGIVRRDPFYVMIKDLSEGVGISQGDMEKTNIDYAEVLRKFPDIIKPDGGSLSDIALAHSFESVEGLLGALMDTPSEAGAITTTLERLEKTYENEKMSDAPINDYHNSETLKAMNSIMSAIQNSIINKSQAKLLGEDYSTSGSHDEIMAMGTDEQKLAHLNNLIREFDIVSSSEESTASRTEIFDKVKEMMSTTAGLNLEIRKNTLALNAKKGRGDSRANIIGRTNDDTVKAYHSEGGATIHEIAEANYESLGGLSIHEFVDNNKHLNVEDLVVGAFEEGSISTIQKNLRERAVKEIVSSKEGELSFYYRELSNQIADAKASLNFDDVAINQMVDNLDASVAPEITKAFKLDKTFYASVQGVAREYLMDNVSALNAINSNRYFRAEKTSMNKAVVELNKGNYESAVDFIKQGMLNHALGIESINMEKARKKIQRTWKKQTKKGALKNVSLNYSDAFIALLRVNGYDDNGAYNLGDKSYLDIFAGIEKDSGDTPLSAVVDSFYSTIPEDMMTGTYANGEMTMGEMIDIYETSQYLLRIGRGELFSAKDLENQTVADTVEQMSENLASLPNVIKPGTAVGSGWNQAKKHMRSFFISGLSRLQFELNAIDAFSLQKGQGIKTAGALGELGANKEAEFLERQGFAMHVIGEAVQTLKPKNKILHDRYASGAKSLKGRVIDSDMGTDVLYGMEKDIKRSTYMIDKDLYWTFDRLVGVMLNLGTKDGRDSLIKGHGFDEATLQKIASIFDRSEINAIQDILNVEGSYYDEFSDIVEKQTNARMEKVEALPYLITTADGKQMTFQGGYHHLFPEGGAEARSAKDTGEVYKEQRRELKASTRVKSGSRKSRLRDENGDLLAIKPPKLSLSTVYRSINGTLHDITHSQYIYDMERIFGNKELRGLIEKKLGMETLGVIDDSLKVMSVPNYKQAESYNALIGALDWMRNASSRSVLTFKAILAGKQGLSMSQAYSAMYKGGNAGKYLIEAHRSFSLSTLAIGDTAGEMTQEVKDILEVSSPMRVRSNLFDQNIADSRLSSAKMNGSVNLFGRKVSLTDLQEVGFFGIKARDMATTLPVWKGSYNQALGENINMPENTLNENSTIEEIEAYNLARHESAIKYANIIVRTSQPSAMSIDLSYAQTNAYLRLISSFMTFLMVFGNRVSNNIRAFKAGQISFKDLYRSLIIEVAVPRWTQLALQGLLYSGKDQPEYWQYAIEPVADMASYIPFFRDIRSYYSYGRGSFAPTSATMFFDLSRKMSDFKDQPDIWNALVLGERSAEYLSGVHVTNLKTIKTAYDKAFNPKKKRR